MKLTTALITAAVLAGCASTPMTADQAVSVPVERVLDRSLLVAQPGHGRVTVLREKDFGGAICDNRVFVDARPVADLRTGEKLVIYLPPGDHIFGLSPGYCGGSLIELSGTVRADKPIALRTGVGASSGRYFQPTAF
jgi:hypothetical protein